MLDSKFSAVVINWSEYSGKQSRKLNYPKPVTLKSWDTSKIKPDLFEAELNHGIALPMSEIRNNSD